MCDNKGEIIVSLSQNRDLSIFHRLLRGSTLLKRARAPEIKNASETSPNIWRCYKCQITKFSLQYKFSNDFRAESIRIA